MAVVEEADEPFRGEKYFSGRPLCAHCRHALGLDEVTLRVLRQPKGRGWPRGTRLSHRLAMQTEFVGSEMRFRCPNGISTFFLAHYETASA